MLGLLVLFFSGCRDSATDLPPADSFGEGLLLPWAELTGRIAYATPASLIIIDAEARSVAPLRSVPASEFYIDVSASRGANRVAVTILRNDGGTDVGVFSLADGSAVRRVENANCPRYLADGRLSFLRGDSLFIESAHVLTLRPSVWSCHSWLPDGGSLVVALTDTVRRSRVYRATLADQHIEPVELVAIGGPLVAWHDPAVSPNGQIFAVVYASTDPITEILLANTAGGIQRKLAEGTQLYGLSWSPAGTQLLGISTVSSAGGLFVIGASGGARKLVGHPVYGAAFF